MAKTVNDVVVHVDEEFTYRVDASSTRTLPKGFTGAIPADAAKELKKEKKGQMMTGDQAKTPRKPAAKPNAAAKKTGAAAKKANEGHAKSAKDAAQKAANNSDETSQSGNTQATATDPVPQVAAQTDNTQTGAQTDPDAQSGTQTDPDAQKTEQTSPDAEGNGTETGKGGEQ